MDDLLVTKLSAQRTRHEVVSRPRLLERLSDGLNSRLILISAPAGFGKTTLFTQWCAQNAPSCDCAWIALDEYDNDPSRFWRHVVASLEATLGFQADAARAALKSAPPQVQTVVASLFNTLIAPAKEKGVEPRPLVITLDDYHWITSPVVHDSVAFAIEHLPAHAHIAILTRADPPFGLARLRVRDDLTELRADQLSFSPDETRAYVRDVMALPIDDVALDLLQTRTEGWPAALHLAALAVKNRPDASVRLTALLKADQFIFDYLAEEIFQHQPAPVQEFLLFSSVLSSLNAPLCDAVTGAANGAQMLSRLQHFNSVVASPGVDGEHYRYHSLVAQVLGDLLRRTRPDIIPELHRRASDWYYAHGQILEAIRHAQQAGDRERVTRCIARSYRAMLEAGDVATLMRLLEATPTDLVEREPSLSLAYAWSHIYALRFADLERYLRQSEAASQATSEIMSATENDAIHAEVSALRAVFESVYGNPERALSFAHSAQAVADPDDTLLQMVIQQALGNAHRALGKPAEAIQHYELGVSLGRRSGWQVLSSVALMRQGQMLVMNGRLREGVSLLEEAMRLAMPKGSEPSLFAAEIALALSGPHYEWNALQEAAALVSRGMDMAERMDNHTALLYHAFTVGRIVLATASPAEVQSLIDHVTRQAALTRSHLLLAVSELFSAWMALKTGQLQLAEGWVEAYIAQQANHSLPPLFHDEADLLVARVRMAQARWAEAEQALREFINRTSDAGRQKVTIEAMALLALALQAEQRPDSASQALLDALTLAQPEGFIRTFVDEGEPMRHLLREAKRVVWRSSHRKGLTAYMDRLLLALGEQAEKANELTEPLTAREKEVLHLIAEGATNRQIAVRLAVSAGTVKAHTNHIFGKLGARNRTEAAARARALALLEE